MAFAPFLLRVDNAMLFDTKVFIEYAVYIQQLWRDRGIKEAFERRREFQLVITLVLPYLLGLAVARVLKQITILSKSTKKK